MRLSPAQIDAIKASVADTLGADAEVYLLGSRTDDTRRGGDIDLYIVSPAALDAERRLDARLQILVALHRRLGERKIDLLFGEQGRPGSAFQQLAREQGIRL